MTGKIKPIENLDNDIYFSDYKHIHIFELRIKNKEEIIILELEAKNSSDEGLLYWKSDAYGKPKVWNDIIKKKGYKKDKINIIPSDIKSIKYIKTLRYVRSNKARIKNRAYISPIRDKWQLLDERKY